jgi:DNA-binding MarR family transcriptional regulator
MFLCVTEATTKSTLSAELEPKIVGLFAVLLRGVPQQLSLTSAATLGTLRDEGPQRVTALAERQAVAQPTMTRLLCTLEQRGLVQRLPDPDDRRACLVSVTGPGLETLDDRSRARAALLEERLARLTDEERRALRDALPALDALLEQSC